MKQLWSRLNGPAKIGVVFALIAGLMAGVGWAVNPQFAARNLTSFLLAVGISSVTWGVVAWAIATAAYDVERETESNIIEETAGESGGKKED